MSKSLQITRKLKIVKITENELWKNDYAEHRAYEHETYIII